MIRGETPDFAAAESGHRILADAPDDEIASTVNASQVHSGTMLPAGLQILYLAEITISISYAPHTCFYTVPRLPRRM